MMTKRKHKDPAKTNGSVAQRKQQGAFNPEVGSSNLPGPTKLNFFGEGIYRDQSFVGEALAS